MHDGRDLEPAHGDYVQYLNDLEKGKVRELKALSPSGVVTSGQNGMLTIKTDKMLREEKKVRQEAERKRRRDSANLIVKIFGPLVLALGVALIGLGLSFLDDLIPIGMFCLFAGFVLTSRTKSR